MTVPQVRRDRSLALMIGVLLLIPGICLGHSQGETWSLVQISDTRVELSYTMPAGDLAELLPALARSPDLPVVWPGMITSGFTVFAAGQACAPAAADFRQTTEFVEVRWSAICPSAIHLTIENHALFAELPNHIHVARAIIDGSAITEKLFTRTIRTWQVTTGEGLVASFARYLKLGIEHIATGYDHLAFLFAIMLLSPRMVTLLLMITGFTIGHSITLAMAVLGYASVNSGAIEALIGFTIALVAAEVIAIRHNLNRGLMITTSLGLMLLAAFAYFSRTNGSMASGLMASSLMESGSGILTLFGIGLFSVCYLALSEYEELQDVINPALTLLFGMIHGFGFAGLLVSIGLPPERLIPALLGFNLGVEVGQLVVFGAVLGASYLVTRYTRPAWFVKDGLASILCALGVYLLVSRSL